MIKVIGRSLQIPKNEKCIGHSGDNKVEIRTFEITDVALLDFSFKLDTKNSEGETGIIDLIKTAETDKIILTWNILEEHITKKGVFYVQLRAFSDSDEKWHSELGCFNVESSINAADYFQSPLPSEFEQMEVRVTTAKNIVVERSSEVAVNAQAVADKTAITLQKAAEVSENTNEVAENREIAELSAQVAAQAYQGLLAKLGTEVATLLGGKLSPEQIPAIAITNTYPVANEAEMLALDCQTGDVCIRTDESKSYILQGTDPSVFQSWQHLQTPTNYADTSGRAVIADNAENANKINGSRVVAMTQAEYDVSVKDPNTVYLVGN